MDKIMKKIVRIVKETLFACSLTIVVSIPILFILNFDIVSECLYKLFKIDKARTMELFLAILPIIFSSLVVIINFWNDYRKEQKSQTKLEIEKINNTIKYFNSVMLKITTNYHVLMNELNLVFEKIAFLKTNQFFSEIITLWEKNTRNIIDLSNNTDFREKIRGITKIISTVYKNTNNLDNYLKYLNNWEPIFSKYHTISIDDREFLFCLRNYISFSKEEKNIINIYSDLLNNGNYFIRTCAELEIAIKTMNECFEKEIRIKIVNNDKLDELLYYILLKIFHFCEMLIREIYFIERFINITSNKFNKYYKKKKNIYKKLLNKNIKPQIISRIIIINNYIDEKLLYDYYKIS
jgi:hypothetical protein